MKRRIKSSYCTNCGKVLQEADNYCPNCGQENDNKRQSFGRVMSDLIQGFLSVDSRLMHSMPALLFRPGFLTSEYLKGRRQRYLDPIRMFITIVVIYFLLSSWGDATVINEKNADRDATEQPTDSTVIFKEGPFKLKVDDPDQAATLFDSSGNRINNLQWGNPNFENMKGMVKRGKTNTDEILDSLKVEKTFWNRFYYGEMIKLIRADFDNFREFLISKLPWIIFFIMPVFALLLKLLYVRRNFLYIDHLIFAFHLHSFYFLLGILFVLLNFAEIHVTGWLLGATFVYTVFAFKSFYKQSWMKTFSKLLLLLILYFIAALMSFILSLIVVFLIY